MSRFHHRLTDPARWAAIKRAVLLRDKRRCRACGLARPPYEVDHIRPLHRGGAVYDPGNLQLLCRGCHIGKTARENTRPGRLPWIKFRDELRPKRALKERIKL